MSILDKDTESKAKQEEMNTDAIWREFITRILPEALQAHALIEFAEERESTPRIKKSLARHNATLDALKLSADSLYWTIVPWRNQTGTQTIEALIEIVDRMASEDDNLEIAGASPRAISQYFGI